MKTSYSMHLFVLFFLLLISACSNNASWGKVEQRFFIPLTYPNEEWKKDDFGISANSQEKELLKKHLPRVFISEGNIFPLDFYKDYLPHSVLKNNRGKIIAQKISREYLKEIERTAGIYLDYQKELQSCRLPDCLKEQRAIYGRVFYQPMHPPQKYKNESTIDFIVLKYNLVFAASGLPKEISWHKRVGSSILGDLENWHELDIHGAIHILLRAKDKKPLILLLAQHNHFRSYVIGKDIILPQDNRLNICIAERSNEPYPCPIDKTKFRTVGNPSKFDFVLGGNSPFFDGGYDIVLAAKDAVEQNLKLQFLPDKDPLYTSWISLGDETKIFGIFPNFYRSGPPGINMNTTPKLKHYTDIAKFWYFIENDETQRKLFSDTGSFYEPKLEPLLEHNGTRLWREITP